MLQQTSPNCLFCICRAEIVLTDDRLRSVSRQINTTEEKDRELRHTLKLLERQQRDSNATVAHKQQLVEDYHSSGLTGSNHILLFPQTTRLAELQRSCLQMRKRS